MNKVTLSHALTLIWTCAIHITQFGSFCPLRLILTFSRENVHSSMRKMRRLKPSCASAQSAQVLCVLLIKSVITKWFYKWLEKNMIRQRGCAGQCLPEITRYARRYIFARRCSFINGLDIFCMDSTFRQIAWFLLLTFPKIERKMP